MSYHLTEVRRQIYHNLWAAYRGWWEWHKLNRKKGVHNAMIILLPSCDREINYLSLLYLDQMLDNRKRKNAVILTRDPVVVKCAPLFSTRVLYVIPFSDEKVNNLLHYYSLFEFDKRLIVASIDKPYGRNGNVLIGKRGTTKEEVFVIGVYQINPNNRPNGPCYDGKDPEILNFLEDVLK